MSKRAYQLTELRYGVQRKIHAELLRLLPDSIKLLRLKRLNDLLRRRLQNAPVA